MLHHALRYVFAILCMVHLSPALAADEADIESYKKSVIDLNKNIGTYDVGYIENQIEKNIEDVAHVRVGSVQDFLLNERGEVEKIVSDLNALEMGHATLNLSYDDFTNADGTSADGTYILAMKAADMEEKLAIFLAGIETAAGGNAEEGLISARRLQGRNITLPDGRSIGTVEQVIADKDTKRVIGVLMKDMNTRPQYERFALPYPKGLRIKNTGFENNLELSEEFAETILDFTAEGMPR